MDRRSFILSAGAAAGGYALPLGAQGKAAPAVRIDALSGVTGFEAREGRMVPTPAFIEAVRAGRIHACSQTLGGVGNGRDRFEASVTAIAEFDRRIADNPRLLIKALAAADIRAARETGRLAVIYNFQDTTALEGDAAKVDLFQALGVRIMQLTYNKRNLAGDGCLESANAGLSDFGRAVIARINGNRILLDLSHAAPRTIAEGIAASSAPPAVTHSGCRALVDVPRNIHDSEIRALAEKGGVMGVFLMPFLRPGGQAQREDLLRHLEHAVNIGGEDHVGIGSDGPVMGLAINEDARARQRAFYEERARLGIAAPGEAADVFNVVEGYNDVGRYERIGDDLRRRGWPQARVDKILGGNFLRLFGEVWGG